MTRAAPNSTHAHRRTPFSARGEPRVWLMAMAVVVCLGMILGMIGLIGVRGASTFWPGRIDQVTLSDGSQFLGVPYQTETYAPPPEEQELIDTARAEGRGFLDAAFDEDGAPRRRRYFVGNRDLTGESYRWVPLWTVASVDRPDELLLVERLEWGPFIGRAEALLFENAEGEMEVEELATDAEGVERLRAALDAMRERRGAIERLDREQIPDLVADTRALEQRWREARLELERAKNPRWAPAPRWARWCAIVLLGGAGTGVWLLRARRGREDERRLRPVARFACLLLAIASAGFVWLERPGRLDMTDVRLQSIEREIRAEQQQIADRQAELIGRLGALRIEDARYRLRLVEAEQGRISPQSRSEVEEPMRLSQIVRVVPANRVGFFGRLGVYFERWWEFLSTNPREGAAAGGVYPVIVGTVTLTLLLTVSVVPLGVIAALYLREYARQGVVTSVIRIAINNLAGVPSIVYGMFGLGFFCYTLGSYVDAGPTDPVAPVAWWAIVGLLLLSVFAGGALALLGRRPGRDRERKSARGVTLALWITWLSAVVLAFWAVVSTPYFGGFFAAKLPEQTTFGGRGVLWASLTLALLTLPVVIVATEEAIAAVPGSMREGSFGCGASKWQTIRSIVLPAAMPGILTGAILAMARGAGEVAPLMLVGAVNLAPALPVSTEFPFLHGDRTFMHLGYHIYTLGFQSPDSEATEPLVWTTTLLLITIVLLLNLVAVVIRAKLRSRMKASAV